MWYQTSSLDSALSIVTLSVIGLLFMGFLSPGPVHTATDAAADDTVQEGPAYRAELTALDESGVTGSATFVATENGLKAQLTAKGLSEGTHPQHIHMNSSCSDFGGVLVGLEPFPEATGGGTINYQSQDIEAPENLADRTVVVHASDGTPVACGPINPASENE